MVLNPGVQTLSTVMTWEEVLLASSGSMAWMLLKSYNKQNCPNNQKLPGLKCQQC